MWYKISLFLLLLSTPLLPSTPYAGLPLWVWTSLFFSICFALSLIISIETEWPDE